MNQKLYKSPTDSSLPKPSIKPIDIVQISSCFAKDIPVLTDGRNDQSKLSAIRPSIKMTSTEQFPIKRLSNLLRTNIDKPDSQSVNVENHNNSASPESQSPNHTRKIRTNANKVFSPTLINELEEIKRPDIKKFALSNIFVKDAQKKSKFIKEIVKLLLHHLTKDIFYLFYSK